MPATLDLDNYKKRVMGDMNNFPVTAPVQKSQRSFVCHLIACTLMHIHLLLQINTLSTCSIICVLWVEWPWWR